MAIYFEGRSESVAGQVAIAQVIENRISSARYPDDTCSVIKQGRYVSWLEYPLRYECQFSFWCDGKPEDITNRQAWGEAWIIAVGSRFGIYPGIICSATNYHSDYIEMPYWAEPENVTTKIGNHMFYKDIK